MEIFEARLRGSHAKAVESIMSRTSGSLNLPHRDKAMKPKGDNIAAFLRKFQIDRENMNLAKRILLCESEHSHKFYQKEWKKTQNFLRVRSNFKRGLSNQQPRIFKFEPITGLGNCLITLTFSRFQSNPIHFRPENLYCLRVLISHNSVNPTNSTFKIASLRSSSMSFYVPSWMRKQKIVCKISELKENEMYDKGKMEIDLKNNESEQEVILFNKQDKNIATVWVQVDRSMNLAKKKKKTMWKSEAFDEKENVGI